MTRLTLTVLSGFAWIAATIPLVAHHSMTASYDESKPVTLTGTVTKFDWSNPHVWVYVDATASAQKGKAVEVSWQVEFASRLELKRGGWTGQSLKVGDVVTVQAALARDGSRRVHGKTIAISGGAKLSEAAGIVALPAIANIRPIPRWPDGHPRLGPEPGQAGYWVNTAGGSLSETATVKMNSEGILSNLTDIDKIAPFQPWAKGLYLLRQKNLLKDDPMSACLPPGGPRQFQAPYGVRFLEEPARQRVFVLSHGGNRNWRGIDLDGRALPKGEDVSPTYFGYSVGRWEGDVLVVQSVGYVERFWLSNGGLPHTESAQLTERISRPNFDTLRYEVTINDPGAYTRPWTSVTTLRWVPSEDTDEYFCDDNNREMEFELTH